MLTPHRSAVSSRTYDQSQSLERHRVASHPNMASPFMLAPCPVGSLNHKDRFAGIPARFNLFAKCSSAHSSYNVEACSQSQVGLIGHGGDEIGEKFDLEPEFATIAGWWPNG